MIFILSYNSSYGFTLFYINNMQDKVKKLANELYEFYERDYTSFINSKLRAISYCNRKIWASDSNDNKLIWVEVKKELKDNY